MNRNVMAAYHTICTKCAVSDAAIKAMEKHQGGDDGGDTDEKPHADDVASECNDTNDDDNERADTIVPNDEEETTTTNKVERKHKIKVCAMCTHEPALSKYDNMPPEASELVSQIQELEDILDSGVAEDGHKLTLREIKALERQVEKLRVEIKEFGKKKNTDEEEEDDQEDGSDNDEESADDDGSVDEVEEQMEDDPFLKAVGGKEKLLVGDAYQQMLLAKAEAQEQS